MSLSTWTTTTTPQPAGFSTEQEAAFDASVRGELSQIVQNYTTDAAQYSPATEVLWSRIGGSLHGGKLTRPRLVKLGHDAFAREGSAALRGSRPSNDRIVSMGCAFELLHTSLLLHDDVIDRDFTRRGRPTLSALYRDDALHTGESLLDAEHAGHSAAIIAGDLLLSASISLALRAGGSHPHAAALESSFQRAIHHAGAGELEDLLYSLGRTPAKVRDVLLMEELKTASYSFKFPLHTGALLAGASMEAAEALASIGGQLGVAYQLIDDVLGTFGDPARTGKSIDSDLREGKSTILTALVAQQPEFGASLSMLRAHTDSVESLRSVLEAADVEAQARALAQDLCEKAIVSAQQMRLPEHVSEQFQDFALLILNRGA
ncbi:geranylgeranyl pyrophosphate synthase [Arthrobacter sp. UYCu511]|uniref:polyprenyl synthetase family protein n=1 Tax=Arthrobacter sp. UYCu511 TaxID=3156337 RepID=UPI00339A872A